MDDELIGRARALRAGGATPKGIARTLGVRPAVAAALVQAIAAEGAAAPPEPGLVGCWVSHGWSDGLGVDGHPEWPGTGSAKPTRSGLVGVLVAREHRRGNKVSACGYLVDAYCLGVKDSLGPLGLNRDELRLFVRQFFSAFNAFDDLDAPAFAAPVEMAAEIVLGAVDYARGLGFEPHPDFAVTAGHLGEDRATGAIRFGRNGKPYFMQGPYDDATRILQTLEASVGPDGFHFLAEIDAFDGAMSA